MHNELHEIYNFFAQLSLPLSALFGAPFFLLLFSIAILPLRFPDFWQKNRNKALVSIIFSVPVVIFFLFRDWQILAITFLDYGAFIALLGALFIISGGIYIRGNFKDTPFINTCFLAIGAILANFIGTTGASMLLIRPLIRSNQNRHYKVHTIVFFIFIVSNCSGILTPLGDPPLFLGFLNGVKFGWTLRLLPQFLYINGFLLVVYYFLDRYFFKIEPKATRELVLHEKTVLSEKFGINGRRNFIYLFFVVATSLFAGYVLHNLKGSDILGESFGVAISKIFQIFAFIVLAVLSYRLTPSYIHERNNFHFHPIVEVAVIFAGIFAAMIPALIILEVQGNRLGITEPWQFFWLTGMLSSFLDNAPTYLTFTSLAKGAFHLIGSGLYELSVDPAGHKVLAAISCGAVFMGANTYIGNGPNFMVRSIAEHNKIKMPSFFNYMLWSSCFLLPLFIFLAVLFF